MACEICFYLGNMQVYSTGPRPEQNKRLCDDCADALELNEGEDQDG